MRGFRRILKIDHKYYSPVSNNTVLETLNRNIGDEKYIQIKRVSEMIMEKSMAYLGQCTRCLREVPTIDAIIVNKQYRKISYIQAQRFGHPRLRQVNENFKTAFDIHKNIYTLDRTSQKNAIWIPLETEDGHAFHFSVQTK